MVEGHIFGAVVMMPLMPPSSSPAIGRPCSTMYMHDLVRRLHKGTVVKVGRQIVMGEAGLEMYDRALSRRPA